MNFTSIKKITEAVPGKLGCVGHPIPRIWEHLYEK